MTWDIDRLTALMAYVQLSLWNVPAEIVVGNTLSLEVREVWHKGEQMENVTSGLNSLKGRAPVSGRRAKKDGIRDTIRGHLDALQGSATS